MMKDFFTSPLVFVGLGNPGHAYEKTRHNVGFRIIDILQDHFALGPFQEKHQGLLSHGFLQGYKIFLYKPMTFMNLSGQGVASLAHFHKAVPENIVVIHDDLDLPFLKVRFKKGGGHGGHNGLRSLDQHLSKDYYRLRIGIGRPPEKGRDVSSYVLGTWTAEEEKSFTPFLETWKQTMDAFFKDPHVFVSRLTEKKEKE